MARPGWPERNKAARSFRQLRRFLHVINPDKVFGTHSARSRSFRNAPCAALLNKVDLLGTPPSMLLEDYCSPNFAASTSALTGEGVRPTFSKLAAVILRRGL